MKAKEVKPKQRDFRQRRDTPSQGLSESWQHGRPADHLLPGVSISAAMTAGEREGMRRLELLREYNRLRKSGVSGECAAALLKTSVPTLWRWQKSLEEFGPRGVAPRTYLCGRKSKAKLWGVNQHVIKRVTALHFALGSNQMAWRAFARSAACPRKLSSAIRRAKQIPLGLLALTRLKRRSVTAVTGNGFSALLESPTTKHGGRSPRAQRNSRLKPNAARCSQFKAGTRPLV